MFISLTQMSFGGGENRWKLTNEIKKKSMPSFLVYVFDHILVWSLLGFFCRSQYMSAVWPRK